MYRNGTNTVTMLSILNLNRRHFLTWRASGFHPKVCVKANQDRILENMVCATHWSHGTCFEDRHVILSGEFQRWLEDHLRGVRLKVTIRDLPPMENMHLPLIHFHARLPTICPGQPWCWCRQQERGPQQEQQGSQSLTCLWCWEVSWARVPSSECL